MVLLQYLTRKVKHLKLDSIKSIVANSGSCPAQVVDAFRGNEQSNNPSMSGYLGLVYFLLMAEHKPCLLGQGCLLLWQGWLVGMFMHSAKACE